MEQNAFYLVTDKIGEALKPQGYSLVKGQNAEEEGQCAVFAGDETAYSILYLPDKKRFELRTCGMTDNGPSGKWTSVSMWLFDPATDSAEQAQDIINDFVETIHGPKKTAVARAKKKRRKDDDNNVDAVFFFNRFVGIFPELKDEMNEEREKYDDIRAVTFAREKLLPKIEALCSAGLDSDSVNRCCTLLNEMYVSGDLDVRSIITIVILNGLSKRSLETLEPLFTKEMAKGCKAGLKMKGKKVKPEKKKKRRSMMAATLNDMDTHSH